MKVKVKIKALSINKAFQGRRFKTAECKAYERDLSLLLPSYKGIKGEVIMWIDFYLVNYARTDVSNLVKVLEDVLVKKGYIEDDRKVIGLHLSKKRSKEDRIEIQIDPI